jgi:hypothetical protein
MKIADFAAMMVNQIPWIFPSLMPAKIIKNPRDLKIKIPTATKTAAGCTLSSLYILGAHLRKSAMRIPTTDNVQINASGRT